MSGKPWTASEKMKLVDLWYDRPHTEVLKALPGRTLAAVRQKARALNLRRPFKWVGTHKEPKGSLMRQLREVRQERNFTARRVAQMIGRHESYISKAETGSISPNMFMMERWCAALGVKMTVVNRMGA